MNNISHNKLFGTLYAHVVVTTTTHLNRIILGLGT